MDLYPAVFVPPQEKQEKWQVLFADIHLTASGHSLPEAFEMAYECLANHLETLVKRRMRRPQPSKLDEGTKKLAAQAEKDGRSLPAESIYQYVPTPNLDEPSIRVTVSMTPRTLEAIDRAAERDGLTRSGFVVAACRERIVRQL